MKYFKAFQDVGRSNNICVDWDGKTSAKEFFDARNLVPLIALYVANMVNDVKMNPVHCVGHSLGAHICHMAAAKLKELSGKPMQRLTCTLALLVRKQIAVIIVLLFFKCAIQQFYRAI